MDALACIVTAAGRGNRFGADEPKQWRALGGRSVLEHAVYAMRPFGRVLVTVHPDDMARALDVFGGSVTLVAGGETRSASVRAALETLEGAGISHVLIHDAARPLVSQSVIAGVIAALEGGAEAAAPGLAVADALWRVTSGQVEHGVNRSALMRAQTPQGFRLDTILASHRRHPEGAADDVELVRRDDVAVVVTAGSEDNFKITWPGDIDRAAAILARNRMDLRIGTGFDVHAFGPGNHVVLCGVAVPHECGLTGHSDADVGMHALTDAILGALSEGDIGRHFPPSDPQWKGANSRIFLAHAVELATARGYRLGNADLTLVCERPKIGPHAAEMQARLAAFIGCDVGRISVKASTSEELGFTGRGEGIAAMASVLMIPVAS